jgi:tRNA threonylcarbamoyl adenosine modification protein YeaZ
MTISLAIDTSTSRTIVAIVDEEKVLFESFHDGATDHGKALPELIAQALKVVPKPERVVVGMGPGPFTGLRVGITFARTFAFARGIELKGVCSLDAIAVDQSEYTVAVDARRKEIYWASYKDGVRVAGPSVNKPAEVAGYIFDVYPDMQKLVALSLAQNETEPIYLRRPDAVPTAERA